MNDSAVRLMVRAHRERLLSTNDHPSGAASPVSEAGTGKRDRSVMRERRTVRRIGGVFVVVVVLCSVVASVFHFVEHISELAAPRAHGVESAHGTAMAQVREQIPARPGRAPVAGVGMVSGNPEAANSQ